MTVGLASEVRALRVNYVGELGWELHHPIEYQNHLFEALLSSGEAQGLALIGSRAVEALRMEKSYPAFWRDLTANTRSLEAGLGRFVDLQKPDFVGRRLSSETAQRRRLPASSWCFGWRQAMPNPFQNEVVYRRRKARGAHHQRRAWSHASAIVSRTPMWSPDHAAEGTERSRSRFSANGGRPASCAFALRPREREASR